MERFINILVVDDNVNNHKELKKILNGNGNNMLFATKISSALEIVRSKEIAILIFNVDSPIYSDETILAQLTKASMSQNLYKIILTSDSEKGSTFINGSANGAIDYFKFPLKELLVQSKVAVVKSMYIKDFRIGRLLQNIFPAAVLNDLDDHGKFSPKRIENGVVLFTDFVGFSKKAKSISPIKLLKKLEHYFIKFDEITEKYKVEKIKTIGDSYMALAGVTENIPEPEIRACLAAIEMRDFMINEKELALAVGRDFWEVRIGIHSGPLVAGIIGTTKFSFDVWGDTVNIAARAEQSSNPGKILVTENIYNKTKDYFNIDFYDCVEIKTRGGREDMFVLNRIKKSFSLYNEGKTPNAVLMNKCDLSVVDFKRMRTMIFNKLKSLLPDELLYHDLSHTINVEKAAIRYAKLEGLSEYDLMLLKTAIYYHDSGFLVTYDSNEEFGIKMAQNSLSEFGYTESEITIISNIIAATARNVQPKTLLEKIMCDADHDYLGRADYYNVAEKLREELTIIGRPKTEAEWIDFQLEFLEFQHVYYTDTARNIRESGKQLRIEELKQKREKLFVH